MKVDIHLVYVYNYNHDRAARTSIIRSAREERGDCKWLFPRSSCLVWPSRSPRNEMIDTLTEIDRISATATRLDALLAGVEEEATRTVAIHLFLWLTRNDDTVDVAKLSAETDLSRRAVKRALYALTLTGKVQRIGHGKPRRYRLVNGGKA